METRLPKPLQAPGLRAAVLHLVALAVCLVVARPAVAQIEYRITPDDEGQADSVRIHVLLIGTSDGELRRFLDAKPRTNPRYTALLPPRALSQKEAEALALGLNESKADLLFFSRSWCYMGQKLNARNEIAQAVRPAAPFRVVSGGIEVSPTNVRDHWKVRTQARMNLTFRTAEGRTFTKEEASFLVLGDAQQQVMKLLQTEDGAYAVYLLMNADMMHVPERQDDGTKVAKPFAQGIERIHWNANLPIKIGGPPPKGTPLTPPLRPPGF